MNSALIALEAQVRADLAKTAHPDAAWLTPKLGPDDRPALDVLVVGAGQSGLATAFGLMRSQVSNILVLDKSEEGQEGPWLTYARMHTLRSPKHFTGPDLDIPSLTYQSWHEARFGEEDWRNLDLISRELWAEYLLWFRRVVDLPVRNGCEVIEISPAAGGLLAAKVQTADGVDTLFARKIVLATGQEGMGDWIIPEPLRHLPSSLCAHAAQPIDFAGLRGKRVAVIGAGASAFDNAATALEAGAAEVHLFCRRAEIQVIQPYRWLTFRGFLRHFCDLDDAWRWRFMRAVLEMREGFPQATYDRCARHRQFSSARGRADRRRQGNGSRRRIADAEGRVRSRLRDLRHGDRHEFCGPARVAKLRRQHRDLGRPLPAAAGRAQPAARPFSLSRRRLRADGARRRRNTVDRGHSCLRDRLHHELRRFGLIDQCDDHGRAEARAWADARPVSRGHRAALGFVQGV